MTATLVTWPSAEPAPALALVCVAWAGAGAAPFQPWAAALRGRADVHGVRLPGRESRVLEPPLEELGAVVDLLAAEIARLPHARVALFGQCSGAIVAYELSRACARARDPRVVSLLVASQLAPAQLAAVVAAGARESQDELARRYLPAEVLEEPELVELLLPALAADVRLLDGYAPGAPPSDVPVTVFHGTADPLVTAADAGRWTAATSAPVEVCAIAGADHLFSGDAWTALGAAVGDRLP